MKTLIRNLRHKLAHEWQRDTAEKTLSLTEHLDELRYRIIVILVTVAGCFLALYPFSENVLRLLRAPMAAQKLYMFTPAEAFFIYLKVTLFAAIVISVPMILYQLWAFVAPGLYAQEKKYAVPFIGFATLFFLLGGIFCYLVIVPVALQFLLGYGGDIIFPMISVSNYISFITMTILVFGAVFELPIVLVFLAKIGMVTPALLKQHRKYAIVLAFVIGAILTPPDVFSQMMMAIPLLILYEISIWACVLFGKKSDESNEETSLKGSL